MPARRQGGLEKREIWWKTKPNEVHETLWPLVRKITEVNQQEHLYSEWLSLFLNRKYAGLTPGRSKIGRSIFRDRKDRLVVNVLQNISETLTSRICAHRPRPRFMTTDAGWDIAQQAKKLQRFTEGAWYGEKTYRHTAMCFKDTTWCGSGFVKVWPDLPRQRVRLERTFPNEIIIDEQGSLTHRPTSMFQRKYVPAETLKAMFPKHGDIIDQSARDSAHAGGSDILAVDLVEVIEAWHEQSSPRSGDGRHSVIIREHTLFDDRKWDAKFPFAHMRWTEVPLGFFGQGLVEQHKPTQEEINKLAVRIQDAMNLFATAWIVMDEDANIPKGHLKNLVGNVIKKATGTEVKVFTPPSMNAQVFGHLSWLHDNLYKTSGVSQLSAGGTKPPGVEHGVAFRELQDIEQLRFGQQHRAWEGLHRDLAELTVNTARRMYERRKKEPDFSVRYVGRKYFEVINWSQVNLEEQSYMVKIWPSSLLPASPVGKLATVQEMMAAGLIDMDVGKMLLDIPDLERAMSLETAELEYYDHIVDRILEHGEDKYKAPQPYMNLFVGIRRVAMHLFRADMEDAPESRLAPLRRWIREAQDELKKLAAANAMLAGGPAPPPGAGGLPEAGGPPPKPPEQGGPEGPANREKTPASPPAPPMAA
jgi:hypothetical protein